MDATVFYGVGLALIAVGIVIILAAVILASTRGAGKGTEGKVKAAGVIMIGIPIIFGTDKKSVKSVLALALALTVALIVAFVLYYWLLR